MPERDWQAEIEQARRRETLARTILQVGPDADEAAVRDAWERQCLRWHPDRNRDDPEAPRRVMLINAARKYLSDGSEAELLDTVDIGRDDLVDIRPSEDNPWRYFVWWSDTYF